jgi:hypothetical protein
MRSPYCLCIPPYQLLNAKPVVMKLGIYEYIVAAETITLAYFINSSQPLIVC